METHVFLKLFVVIFATFSTFPRSVVGVDVNAIQSELFTKLKCNNSAVCLASEPRRSLGVRSEMDCVSKCQLQKTEHELCVGVNFRQANRDFCDMFYIDQGITNDSNFTFSDKGCQYIQRGTFGKLNCALIFPLEPFASLQGTSSIETTPTATTTTEETTTISSACDTHVPGVLCVDGPDPVIATTLLNDQLFVLRPVADQGFISVYNATSLKLLWQLTDETFSDSYAGLAIWALDNHLYITSFYTMAVHIVDLSAISFINGTSIAFNSIKSVTWSTMTDSITRWPIGMSVTKAGNVLLSGNQYESTGSFIAEYTPTGSLVKSILDTNSLSNSARQVVELSNGIWLYSRKVFDEINELCMVSTNGSQIRSFRPNANSPDASLSYAFAVDSRGYILVADRDHNAILVVNPSMTDVRQLPLPNNIYLRGPNAICLDESRGRLYIGECIDGEPNRLLAINNVTNYDALFT